MMGEVYRKAESVASCIGPGDMTTRLQASAKQDPCATVAVLEELDSLPYFKRLWIKQEVILAQRG